MFIFPYTYVSQSSQFLVLKKRLPLLFFFLVECLVSLRNTSHYGNKMSCEWYFKLSLMREKAKSVSANKIKPCPHSEFVGLLLGRAVS